ncbi:MAG: hypothetical protein RID42_00800 [Alphaproteobacteria bacterium]
MTKSGNEISAIDMARQANVEPKSFRRALRAEGLTWHRHAERWTVDRGGPEHRDMTRVLNRLVRDRQSS